jgi:hypothetical protein
MPRAEVQPVMDAIYGILAAIPLGGGVAMPVGDGTDPNHELPYLILMRVNTGLVEGSMEEDDLDADEELRVQINGCGATRAQAEFASDRARRVLKKSSITAALVAAGAGRVCQYCTLDGGREPRNDLGMTTPLWEAVDQYLVKTTPA